MFKVFRLLNLGAVLRIHDILVRIRIHGSMPLFMNSDLDPDPAIFVIDLQDGKKKNYKKVFLFITF
jgi:hypothetical protein